MKVNDAQGKPSGHAGSASIRHGAAYKAGTPIQPSWAGKWKDTSNDQPITLASDVTFDWQKAGNWYWVAIGLSPAGVGTMVLPAQS